MPWKTGTWADNDSASRNLPSSRQTWAREGWLTGGLRPVIQHYYSLLQGKHHLSHTAGEYSLGKVQARHDTACLSSPHVLISKYAFCLFPTVGRTFEVCWNYLAHRRESLHPCSFQSYAILRLSKLNSLQMNIIYCLNWRTRSKQGKDLNWVEISPPNRFAKSYQMRYPVSWTMLEQRTTPILSKHRSSSWVFLDFGWSWTSTSSRSAL